MNYEYFVQLSNLTHIQCVLMCTCVHLKRRTPQAAAFVGGRRDYNGVLHSTLRCGEVTGRACAVAHQNALVMTFSCGHIEGGPFIQLPANCYMAAVTVRVCSDGGEGAWSCRQK